MTCPTCNSPEVRWIGTLGTVTHAQCRRCAAVYRYTPEDEE